MKPVSNEYYPMTPRSINIVTWLKKEQPKEFKRQ
ncbi:hypothetical protein FHR24_003022 [Wenyingzhuangia heitensis]|uniref:Uncharacterized protein n=1 Tax=Wenyingzhuangia heitensis TaxID=1487859 RepID=A0ABX0UDP2_9FLAO|nr:hypothetical protein [Wenyingzhuangia heitensis]